ncbi:MAG: exodeoxyribonuclease VII large subunit, partial [Kiritimatiellae bacterium]|nr:exodeoxyribonuclease VII large subunit [Kiritimatiellia bacterium]
MNSSEQNNNEKRKVYKVAELTRMIKASLEGQFGNVWIEGELSNVRQPASGHYYLTIKDSSAQISAVLFRGNQAGIKFQIKDGIQVRAFGQVSV